MLKKHNFGLAFFSKAPHMYFRGPLCKHTPGCTGGTCGIHGTSGTPGAPRACSCTHIHVGGPMSSPKKCTKMGFQTFRGRRVYHLVSHTGEPASQPSSQPAIQPARQPASQPSSQPGSQPASQPPRRWAGEHVGVPSSQPAIQPARGISLSILGFGVGISLSILGFRVFKVYRGRRTTLENFSEWISKCLLH